MSHNVHTSTYPENVDKKAVQREWDEYAAHEDWQEGCSGLPRNIRWIDHTCEDYAAAEEYIKSHDDGRYDQLAVKFKDYPRSKPTKEIEVLAERVKVLRGKINDIENVVHYKDVKAEFVSCRNCGSKIARAFIKSNYCPVCRADLRPQSTLDRLASLKTSRDEAQKKYEAAVDKAAKKNKPVIKWLVKIEYHT